MAETVEYSNGLIISLENSLKSAFYPYPHLTRKPRKTKAGPRFDVSLQNGLKRIPTDEGAEQEILPILTSDRQRSPFWFGFIGNFAIAEDIHRYTLEHASLTVFHDLGLDLVPLFRAEWDPRDAAKDDSKHAQPHWHFIQTPERIELLVRIVLSPPEGTITEFAPERKTEMFSGIADAGKFHFAMTSLWEKSETPPYTKRRFDSNNFPKWFDNLNKYIACQIAYLLSHMPSPVSSSLKDFQEGS